MKDKFLPSFEGVPRQEHSLSCFGKDMALFILWIMDSKRK